MDNILQVHSLRPHTLEGHLGLCKAVLHHGGNALPRWFLETIGILVSLINRCDYCVDHHFAGLLRLVGERDATSIRSTLDTGGTSARLGPRELVMLACSDRLTRAPESITKSDTAVLREAGVDEGEILEVNQVTACFAYANRTALGLGVNIEGDVLGLSPGGDAPDDWQHR